MSSIPRITQGQTLPAWRGTVKYSDDSVVDLTGATFTGVLYEVGTSLRKSLTAGSYSITDATAGQFSYAVGSADVDTPGLWDWETAVTISAKVVYLVQRIEIEPRRAT